jgi:hypothetical protein
MCVCTCKLTAASVPAWLACFALQAQEAEEAEAEAADKASTTTTKTKAKSSPWKLW